MNTPFLMETRDITVCLQKQELCATYYTEDFK